MLYRGGTTIRFIPQLNLVRNSETSSRYAVRTNSTLKKEHTYGRWLLKNNIYIFLQCRPLPSAYCSVFMHFRAYFRKLFGCYDAALIWMTNVGYYCHFRREMIWRHEHLRSDSQWTCHLKSWFSQSQYRGLKFLQTTKSLEEFWDGSPPLKITLNSNL